MESDGLVRGPAWNLTALLSHWPAAAITMLALPSLEAQGLWDTNGARAEAEGWLEAASPPQAIQQPSGVALSPALSTEGGGLVTPCQGQSWE